MVDMHIHSTFSFDGSSTMEEYCQKAISMNVNKICFTDHVDFNTEEKNYGVVKDISIQNFDVEDYLNEINRLRRKYHGLEILSGIEFSESHLFKVEFEHYKEMPFDCIIGSIHHCYNGIFPGALNIGEEQAKKEYYDLMLNMVKYGGIQTLAHFDFPRRYFDNWDVDDNVIDEIFSVMVEKQIVLEINTSSIKRNGDEPLPKMSILKRYIEMGGRKAVLGSDAHNVSRLAMGFDQIVKVLPKEIEIGYFKQRQFVSIN